MDNKYRQELEKNELAKWFTAQYEDWIRPNSSWLGYAILGGLFVVAIIIVTARVSAWNQNTAWQQYYAALASANATAELEILADSTSGVVGARARLALAQMQLTEGSERVFIDKNEAITMLTQAIESFQRVQRATNDPVMLQQAGFGLGQCWEILAAARVGDDIAKAKEEYQRIIDRWEEGPMIQRAQRQLARLQQPATVAFLAHTAARVVEVPAFDRLPWTDFDRDDALVPGGPFDFSSLESPFGEGFMSFGRDEFIGLGNLADIVVGERETTTDEVPQDEQPDGMEPESEGEESDEADNGETAE